MTTTTNNTNKTYTLTFLRKELLLDIKNLAFVAGDVMKAAQPHDPHQLQDIAEDGNIEWTTRMMDLAFRECVEALYPYSKTEVEDGGSQTDEYKELAEYVLYLSIPSDFSQTTINLLREYIHDYIIYRVLAGWVRKTDLSDPSAYKKWEDGYKDLKDKITTCMSGRIGLRRRILWPYGAV